MRTIPVYKAERDLGLAELIQSNSSIAYHTKAKADANKNIHKALTFDAVNKRAIAENKNQIDLFYLKDILVSTGWNLNEDIFIHDEIWPARNTAEDKQFNLGHNQKEIIGHMTSQYAINSKGEILGDELDIDSLPDEFHIVSTAVIYRYWPDKDYMEKINQIVAEIEEAKEGESKWFVSMECLFSNFDYGVIDSSGTQSIIPRNSASAFLTKHLRAYGGTGEYKDCKLGRVLRNITFSGKGLVENPANPKSIIFEDSIPFKAQAALNNPTFLVDVGYTNSSEKISKENDSMANENTSALEEKLKETQAALMAEKTAKAELEKKMTEDANKAVQAKVDELTKVADAAKAKTVDVETQLKAKIDELAKANKDLVEVNEKLVKAEKSLAEIELEKKALARKTELVTKLNFDETAATKLVKSYAKLSDEDFAEVVANTPKLTVASTKVEPPEVKVEDKKKVDASVLENVVVDKNNVGSASASVVNDARAKVTEFLSKSRKNKTSSDDEVGKNS